MFSAQRQLPALRHLSLSADSDEAEHDPLEAEDPPAGLVDAQQLHALAACCPGLRALQLSHVLVGVASALHALARLRAAGRLQLESLRLAGPLLADWTTPALAHLSGLRELAQCLDFTDAGLARLTTLTSLSRLEVRDTGCRLHGGEGSRYSYAIADAPSPERPLVVVDDVGAADGYVSVGVCGWGWVVLLQCHGDTQLPA
jgi:hypothetical protein